MRWFVRGFGYMKKNKTLLRLLFILMLCAGIIIYYGLERTTQQPIYELIADACVAAYPEEYARKFIMGGGLLLNEKGGFGISRGMKTIDMLLRQYIHEDDAFLDLGSGDGRIVLLAAQYAHSATGIEYDRTLCEISNKALGILDVQKVIDSKSVTFLQGDFFDHSISDYDVIYLSFGSVDNTKVYEKVVEEMQVGKILILYWCPRDIPLEDIFVLVDQATDESTGKIIRVYRKKA